MRFGERGTRAVDCRRKAGGVLLFGVILLFALSPVVASSGDPAPEGCAIAPQAWQPSLDDVIGYVEEKQNAETNAPQSALTRAGQIRADLWDAQLFLTYVRLMQALDGKAQVELLKEQQQWLSQRAEQAGTAVTSRGGTLAPLEYSGEYAKITEQRERELQHRLQDLANQKK